MSVIVRCTDVKKTFAASRGYARQGGARVRALDGVSLEIKKGETFGLVGESGSGKTTLGRIILALTEKDSGKAELYTERPQIIFQDPYNSLDPKMRVADILSEGLVVCRSSFPSSPVNAFGQDRLRRAGVIREKLENALDMVRLPRSALAKYPHQFSGGERQRIAIARAILNEPEFIVCDEPVSSLDVTIQLQILRLLKEIQKAISVTYLFISHDLRAVRFMADRIAVMREGRIVEEGTASSVYTNPQHPYTRLLLSSIPTLPK